MILAGDIGGTKADFAVFEPGDPARKPRFDGRVPTRDHDSLHSAIGAFLGNSHPVPERAVFGIAGPVKDNRCEATNLPWLVDGNALGEALGTRVTLLNDLATTAWGLSQLGREDLEVLHPGEAAEGTRALIAAGTGLGESLMVRGEDGWIAVATEGGHTDYAPRDPLEDELMLWLRAKYERVSYERILSGRGIADLYRFMTATQRGHEPAEIAKRFASADDPAVVVTETALDGSCERAALAIDLFCEVYGAEAGNLALKALALGGIYVGGGIAPRLLPFLRRGSFVSAFHDKGRLTPLLGKIPVSVILDPRTSLWGAAAYAMLHP